MKTLSNTREELPIFELQLLKNIAFQKERVAAKRLAKNKCIAEAEALRELFCAQIGSADLSGFIAQRQADRLAKEDAQKLRKDSAYAKHIAKKQAQQAPSDRWCAWFDASAIPNPGRCGIGAVLRAPDGRRWEAHRDIGYGDSSAAEYQALMLALEMAIEQHCTDLLVFGDSRVVIDDISCTIEKGQSIGSTSLAIWRDQVQQLLQQFMRVQIQWIPRHRNQEADRLARPM